MICLGLGVVCGVVCGGLWWFVVFSATPKTLTRMGGCPG